MGRGAPKRDGNLTLSYKDISPSQPELRKKQVKLHQEVNHIKTLDLAYVWLWEIGDSIFCTYSCTLCMLYLVVILVAYRKKLISHTHLDLFTLDLLTNPLA